MTQTLKSLASVEESLNGWLKPKIFGESWDNIGLLVGSGKFSKEDKIITGIIVCNDLKPAVVEEAIAKNANLVIAYHPPIFSGMKAIAYGSWKEQLIARCLANDISVYSPHTTLDAIAGGINDRVIEALKSFGSKDSPLLSKAIQPSSLIDSSIPGLLYRSSFKHVSTLVQSLNLVSYPDVAVELDVTNAGDIASIKIFGKPGSSENQIQKIRSIAKETGISDFQKPAEASPAPFGAGRIVHFSSPVDLSQVVDAIKVGLNLDYVQLAFAGKREVQSAAVCVGSGGSLLNGVQADVFITGEMSHHTILDSTFAGTSVILCNHCSSERHYLPKLANIVKLLTCIDQVFVSQEDKSPLSLSE